MDLIYDGFTLTKLAIFAPPPLFFITLSNDYYFYVFIWKQYDYVQHTQYFDKIHLIFLKWQKIYDLACSRFIKELQVSFNWWPLQNSTKHSHFLFSNIQCQFLRLWTKCSNKHLLQLQGSQSLLNGIIYSNTCIETQKQI